MDHRAAACYVLHQDQEASDTEVNQELRLMRKISRACVSMTRTVYSTDCMSWNLEQYHHLHCMMLYAMWICVFTQQPLTHFSTFLTSLLTWIYHLVASWASRTLQMSFRVAYSQHLSIPLLVPRIRVRWKLRVRWTTWPFRCRLSPICKVLLLQGGQAKSTIVDVRYLNNNG